MLEVDYAPRTVFSAFRSGRVLNSPKHELPGRATVSGHHRFPESALQSIATPTLSLDSPLPPLPSLPDIGPSVAEVPYVSNAPLDGQADLFPIFYGYPRVNVVEIISPTHPLDLPASIADVGTANVPTAAVLDTFQTVSAKRPRTGELRGERRRGFIPTPILKNCLPLAACHRLCGFACPGAENPAAIS